MENCRYKIIYSSNNQNTRALIYQSHFTHIHTKKGQVVGSYPLSIPIPLL